MKYISVIIIFLFVCFFFVSAGQKLAEDQWKGQDKTKHFVVSTFGTYWLYTGFETIHVKNPELWAGVSMFTVGIGKEIYDIPRTGFSYKDLTYDFVGCAVGVGTLYFMKWIAKNQKHVHKNRRRI